MNQSDWESAFERQCGVPLRELLRPISDQEPTGASLVAEGLYREIKQAREQDDASLPQGEWECELKRADWARVSRLSLEALRTRSKDLQLGLWLLEAQLQQLGLAAIAPVVLLITRLCEQFWEGLHPEAQTDEGEQRANVLYAASRKCLPQLRLIPICGRGDVQCCWADWMRARRNQQLEASGVEGAEVGSPTLEECQKALALSVDADLAERLGAVQSALASLENFRISLRPLAPHHALSWGEVPALLQELERFFSAELKSRGYEAPVAELQTAMKLAPEGGAEGSEAQQQLPAAPEGRGLTPSQVSCRSRAEAYAQLQDIAKLLAKVDPHSPTPYLLERAVAWGQLTTAELYQQLFVQGGGQLSIFELMGIDVKGQE